MKELKFNPVAGKNSEILYSKPCVLQIFDNHLVFRSEFGYSTKTEDEMMPSKDISVDEMSVYLKQHISCVEWAYSSESEIWFFQLWHNGESSYWNVEGKAVAMEIVDAIKKWLLNN